MTEKRTTLTLCGGFAAEMTVAEHNAWGDFCVNCKEFRDLHRAKARLAAAIACQAVTFDGVNGHADKEIKVQVAMFNVARDWCAENIKSEEQRAEEEREAFRAESRDHIAEMKAINFAGAAEHEYLRPEVRAFARAMEDGLRRHDEERGQGWKVTTVGTLMNGAVGQFSRLRHDVKQAGNATGACLAQSVLKRAAATANLIMMVADVGGGLKIEEGDGR